MYASAFRPAARLASAALFFVSVAAFAQQPGALDLTYGGSARARVNFSDNVLTDAGGWDAVVQAPNNPADPNYRKIVVVGSSAEGTRPHFAVVRLNINGTRDMGFGNLGVVKEIDLGTWDTLTDVAMQSDNKIVVLGYVSKVGGTEDWRMLRYTANGDRDTTFSGDGLVEFNVPTNNAARTKAVTIDSQGRIYAVGYNTPQSGNSDMYIYRLLSNGTFDAAWGTGGRVSIAVDKPASANDQGWGIGIQSTGKVVIAGRAGNQPVVLRLNTNGTIDTTFGTSGFTYLNTGGSVDYFRGMTLDSSDRIIAVGKFTETVCINITNRGMVARFTANGALDTTFSGGDSTPGYAGQIAGRVSNYEDVEVTPAGKIVVTGQTDFSWCNNSGQMGPTDYQIAAFRFNDNGSPDTSFDTDGAAYINVVDGYHEQSHGIAIQPDGDVLVPSEGYALNLQHMMVVRFNGHDGSIDETFNTNGQVLTSSINKKGVFATRLTGGSADFSYGTAVQADGKVVQVGATWNGWDYDFGVTRLTTAGILDLTFGGDDPDYADAARRTGKVVIDTGAAGVNDNTDTSYAVAFQSDGKIVVAGTTTAGSSTTIKLFRLTTAGILDTTFGTSGFTTSNFSAGGQRVRAIVVDAQNKIFLTGETYSGGSSNLLLARYSASGAQEASVQDDSGGSEEGHALAFQPDGKIVVAGRHNTPATGWNFYVGRFNSDFTVDNSFGLGRTFLNGVIVGDATYQGTFFIPHENRATPTAGTPNPTGTRISVSDQAEWVVVEADGRITLGGRTVPTAAGARPRYALVRLTASGWLDPTFGTNGWVSTYFPNAPEDNQNDSDIYRLLAQNDGKLVGLGTAGSLINVDFAAARYNWDNGTLDTAFDTDGKSTIGVGAAHDFGYSGMMASDGKIVIGGFDYIREDFISGRWEGDAPPTGTPNGAPDLITDSTRANYPGTADNITNVNAPTFGGNPCVVGESVILQIVNQATNLEHTYKARHLCRPASNNNYAATVPKYPANGGTSVGFLPDGTYKIAAYAATGAGNTAVSPFISNVVIDTFAAVPTLASPTANPIEKKDAELPITFSGGGAENLADVTVLDTTGVVWNATTGAIVSGTPVAICTGTANASGNWSCQSAAGALSLGLHRVKVQQQDIASNYSALCVTTPANASCTAEVSFYVKAQTTTSVISSVNPSVYGQPVTLTAQVRSNVGTPSGNVVMTYDNVARPPQALVAGDAAFSPTMPMSVATHTLSVSYPETDQYFSSSTAAPFEQVVNKADTAMVLTPSVAPSVFGQPVSITPAVSAVAPGAGTPTGTLKVTVDGGAEQTIANLTTPFAANGLSVGDHTIVFTYAGDGNFNGSTQTIIQTVNKAPSATALASSANPSIFDGSVTFTATVSIPAPGAGSPTGSVVFRDGVTELGTFPLDGTFKAQLTTTALLGGSHPITAEYVGDGNFLTSTSASLPQVVNPKATTTTVSTSANPSEASDPVTITATVNDTRATGTVEFYEGATLLATETAASGVASFVKSDFLPGLHPIVAKYGGDTNFAASDSPQFDQNVLKVVTTTALVSSESPTVYGTEVTLTATVSDIRAGGTMSFKNGTTEVGTAAVVDGVATLAISTLPVGTLSLTAVYSGDVKFDTSTSTALEQVVTQATSTTSVATSLTPSPYASTITLTATVTPTVAAGNVVFKSGATPIGTIALSGGTAILNTSALGVGTHQITATYEGDANVATSTSTSIEQIITIAPTATSLGSSLNPSIFGASVTFTATLTAGATGDVSFFNGASLLGTVPLTGNTAAFSTSALIGGTHSITASYAGDGNYAPSTSSVLSQTVDAASTTTTLGSSLNPSTYGTEVVFTATVSAGTGTVTFKEGATTLGTGTLTAGSATFATSSLSAGTHSVVAVYEGDGNYATSTSAGVSQVVDPAVTTTSLVAAPLSSVFGENVTFTATVTTGATGTVEFREGLTVVGSGILSGNTAVFSTSSLSSGSHTIEAVYLGDGNYASSTSAAANLTVATAASSISVTSAPNPSTFGGMVTITATSSTGATGTVTFFDGAATIGTAPVVSDVATLSISTLGGGAHSLTASYPGDSNYAPSTSAVHSHTVNTAPTTTTIVSSANPSERNASVTFTATVTAGATGSVSFFDGVTPLGTANLTGTDATLSTAALSPGPHSITATYGGDVNFAPSTSPLLSQTVNRGPTTTSLVSTVNPSTFGSPVTFNATVTAGATGTVTFSEGATTLGSGTITAGVASFTTSALSAGNHSITATYDGDTEFAPSTSTPVSQTVDPAPTSTSLASAPNPSTYGAAATFTATVTTGATGNVEFREGVTLIGSAAINAGSAVFQTTTLPAGPHSITAFYLGDGNYAASNSSTIVHVVNQAPSTVTVSSSLNPSTFGQAVTFTATLSTGATGTVNFFDGATPLGSAVISSDAATLTTSSLGGGSHSISAVYAGDSNYLGATSNVLNQTVDVAPTTTSVISSTNPSERGASVTFTATVTSGATGNVTFFDGVSALGTVALSGNTAALSTSALSAGIHAITATYGGDANYGTSTSTALNQTVNRGPTVTTLGSSPNPSTYGSAATFTATVTAGATGSVTFADGGTPIGSATLSGGSATLSPTTLSTGTHSITATYEGDSEYAASTSTVLSHVVNKATPPVAVASSLNPSTFGSTVTFTATLPLDASGTVNFLDGASLIGSASVTSGSASLSTSALAAGAHNISAAFQGDANYLAATSPVIVQTVNKAPVSVSIASSANPVTLGQNVTFTATVPAAATGSITFTDGGTPLGSVAIAAGSASLTTSALTAGIHTIVANYNGDGNHAASTSSALQQDVWGPATITPAGSVNRVAGGNGSTSVIATVSHVGYAAGTLAVSATSVPPGITLSAINNQNGTISASISASCGASVGANTVTLQVLDGGGLTATANLTVNVTANPVPTLGTYPDTAISGSGEGSIAPTSPPVDNGSVTLAVAGSAGFTGTASVNNATGEVFVSGVNAGVHTLTVTATDNCGAQAFRTFTIRPNNPPTAQNLFVTTAQGVAVAVSLSASDSDGDDLTFSIVAGPSHGTLTGVAPNLTYTPAPSFLGDDEITYIAGDGLDSSSAAYVTIKVNLGPPVITSVSPKKGPTAGRQTVLIEGSRLEGATAVTFGGVSVVPLAVSDTSVTVITPAHAEGTVDVTIVTPNGTATAPGSYSYVENFFPEFEVLPVMGSLPGAFGSFFRTELQLFNDSETAFTGELTFHPQGAANKTGDKTLALSIAPRATLFFADVVEALGTSGLGSGEIEVKTGRMPRIISRVYNDGGEKGTTGMVMDSVSGEDALQQGETGVLIAPSSSSRFRFNIGIRTLNEGATIELTLRDSTGRIKHVSSKNFPATHFVQLPAADFVGVPWEVDDTVSFRLSAGSAIVYGATTDNTTQDPSYQQARRASISSARSATITVVGSTPGAFGSFFKTEMQFYNPGTEQMNGRFVFHPQGAAGTSGDPEIAITIEPGQTRSFADFLPLLGLDRGLGSVDVSMSSGALPISVVRIFNDAGEKGTTGMGIEPLAAEFALSAGERGVLLAPSSSERFRFNVGVRTLSAGATIVVTQRNAEGSVVRTVTHEFEANYFRQMPVADLLGGAAGPNDSLTFHVQSGAAFVYGSMTDNITQDPTYQLARP
jgi:uncharacterized delta-60 repeat protein